MEFINLDCDDVSENIISMRLRFYERKQNNDETFDEFLTELFELAKNCLFNEQEEWLIRDRIIFGSIESDLKEYFLKISENPSLDEIISIYRFHEKFEKNEFDFNNYSASGSELTESAEENHDCETLSDACTRKEWMDDYDDTTFKYNLTSSQKLINLDVEYIDQIPCKLCNQIVFSQNYNAHLKIHLADNKFECVQCRKHFDSLSILKYHLYVRCQSVHPEGHESNIVCTICSKIFKKNVYLKKHMLLHEVETARRYECYICKKQLKALISLVTHLNYHHLHLKTVSCDECGKSFRNGHTLNIHRRIHTGEKPFACPICHRKFRRLGDLKSHAIKHTDYRPFKCDLCHKSFGIKYQLKVHHMAVHRNERPFPCGCCNKTFRTKSHLNDHMLIHTGEKPFKCVVCSKAYRKKSNMKTHVKRHHGETLFE